VIVSQKNDCDPETSNNTQNGSHTSYPEIPPNSNITTAVMPALFCLPEFDSKLPESWFNVSEVFKNNGDGRTSPFFISNSIHRRGKTKYIQNLLVDKNEIKPLTRATQILKSIYGEREEEKLQKLSDGVTLQGKPSVILEEIKRLCIAVGVSESEGFIKRIWLKHLTAGNLL